MFTLLSHIVSFLFTAVALLCLTLVLIGFIIFIFFTIKDNLEHYKHTKVLKSLQKQFFHNNVKTKNLGTVYDLYLGSPQGPLAVTLENYMKTSTITIKYAFRLYRPPKIMPSKVIFYIYYCDRQQTDVLLKLDSYLFVNSVDKLGVAFWTLRYRS